MVLSADTVEVNSILPPGNMLGCYRVEGFLGQGGFGVTYLALDTKLDLQVAVKEYLPENIARRATDDTVQPKSSAESDLFTWGLSRFIKEAQTLAKFNHQSIVRVMAVFELNGTAYMVMEYERGQELKALIHQPEMRSEASLKRIISPVIDGLSEVHRHGYIHRDIKPGNILIRNNGSPVLLDFGSARLATGAQTQSLTALVSVGYAPLEQYNDSNDSQQGPWTDVYALGAVLYFAITGNVPVDSTLRGSAVVNGRQDPLPPLEQLAPENVSASFCRAIDWALSFRIRDRPQSLDEWRSRLFSDELPKDDRTVLMPRLATRPLEQHLLSSGEHTARNQRIDIHSAEHTVPTDRQRTSNEFSVNQGAVQFQEVQADIKSDSLDADHGWETSHAREQRTGLSRSKRATKGAASKRSAKSRTAVIIGFSCITLSLLAIGLKSRWLPTVQAPLPISPDTHSAPVEALSPQVSGTIEKDEHTATQAQQQATMLAAEQQIANQEQQHRAAEAERLIKQLEQDAAAEAARQAELEAQQAAADAARLVREQAIRDQETAAREKLEATRVANEAARQLAEEAAAAAALAQRKTLQEERLAAQKTKRERQLSQQGGNNESSADKTRVPSSDANIALNNETERVASLETSSQLSVDPTRPITDSDIENVLQQFNSLKQAIVDKNESAVSAMTFPSERKISYFRYLFRTFESIEISLGGVRTSTGDQTVRANLNISRMKRGNGDVVFPPTEFKTIPIYSVRTDEWSKVHW